VRTLSSSTFQAPLSSRTRSHPDRLDRAGTPLSPGLRWPEVARLDFEAVDLDRFPCPRLAYAAGRRGGTAPAVLVGADETAVALFLRGELRLTDIPALIERALERHTVVDDPSLEDVLAASAWAQDEVLRLRGLPPRDASDGSLERMGRMGHVGSVAGG